MTFNHVAFTDIETHYISGFIFLGYMTVKMLFGDFFWAYFICLLDSQERK